MQPHPSPEPPVLVRRAAFAELISQAERAAENPKALPDLLEAVRVLEAERHAAEWDAEDARVTPGTYVGDADGGYFRWMQVAPEARGKPDTPPLKVFWRKGDQEFTAVDEPPVSPDQMARLQKLDLAKPSLHSDLEGAPVRVFYVTNLTYKATFYDPPIGVAKAAGPPGGSWIVSGLERRPTAWVGSSLDADYMVSAVRMAQALEREVYPRSAGSIMFTRHVEKNGLLGLVRSLRNTIEPEERWEPPPPEALSQAGAEVERSLVAFLAARRERRGGR